MLKIHHLPAFLAVALLFPFAGAAQDAPAPGRDWLTWGYDAERTGWNKGENTLTKNNVRNLTLKWSAQIPTTVDDIVISTLTAPVVVEGASTPQGAKDLLFVLGADSSLFALDAASGKIFWQRAFPNTVKPQHTANVNCPNSEQATPAIDKPRGLVFFTSGDGMLHALALGTGEEKMAPVSMVTPFSRNWSLNLIDGVVYTVTGRGCGNGTPNERGNVTAVDTNDLTHPQMSRFHTGKDRLAGSWARGGAIKGPKGVYVQTADGPNDAGSGVYGNAIVAVLPRAFGLADSFVAPSTQLLNAKDLDFAAGSPVIFPFQNRTLLATGGKEGMVYILDTNNLGGPTHSKPLYISPRLANDEETYAGRGIWGGMTAYVNTAGERLLYVPIWGPPSKSAPKFPGTHGDAPNGSVMAFKLAAEGTGLALQPQWMSRDLLMPDGIAVANGVVYAVQSAEQTVQHPDNPEGHGRAVAGVAPLTPRQLGTFRSTPVGTMTLFALDAETGKELYSSRKAMGNFTHFTQPVVAMGKIFLVSHDAHVYAFGLK